MATSSPKPIHPGSYVRSSVIPNGMSVQEASERLGIARPTLSNFLNGKAALSQDMAVRLEKAFAANRKLLLDMQAAYDQRRANDKEITVRTYVPNFLTIKAKQIEEWADNLDARSHLPVLLRKLVCSTVQDLYKIDFPGYDNAERHGSDGIIDAGAATPWVPQGVSYWEFGTNKNPSGKAKKDYGARLDTVDSAERANSTFIFVTPRNWASKSEWEKQKNDAGDWKAVRAFDASDIEQWLEQSVTAQIWLSEQLGLSTNGYETLEQAWHRWAYSSKPHLTSDIFTPSISVYRNKFMRWLEEPSEKPFVVAADSWLEALAFLACLFNEKDFLRYKDLTAVFKSPEALRTLASSTVPLIPIVHSLEAERELVDGHLQRHCIVIRPRNAVDKEPDVALDLLNHDAFKNAIISMGIEEIEVDRLARKSGRSPTILRRCLSPNEGIRKPAWADNSEKAKALVPLALTGAWHIDSEADREIVSRVAGKDYEVIEYEISDLLQFDDSPVWSIGHYRGVTSKIDALFAIHRMVTQADIDRFFVAAEYVLSEADPSLELPEQDRWAAAVYGKTRNHSNALRTGVCETLVILSVHGNELFQRRLGIDVDSLVVLLIRKLLTPLTLDKLRSHDRDLPRYAEAAPDEFLNIIEEDLRREDPVVLGLLKPVDSGCFGAFPLRTGLLWALECLAWNPQNLSRVSVILAQLSQRKIDDNWTNKPKASLRAIFRAWIPQTAASLEQRVKVLEMLTKRFPDIGWDICIEQIKVGHQVCLHSYRPLWRSDASGFGKITTQKEFHDFHRKALDLLMAWPTYDEKTLGDLVEALELMPEEDRAKVWDLITDWSRNAEDNAKATLRERIRRYAFTRRPRNRKRLEETRTRASEAYDTLCPHDLVIRHSWLFASQWLPESIDELQEEDFDFRKRDERIARLRSEAIAEIWAERAFEGVKEMIIASNASVIVGQYVALSIADLKQRVDFIRRCFSLDGDLRSKAEWCIQGFLQAIEDDLRDEVLLGVAEELSAEERIRLFILAPFQASTWRFLDGYGSDITAGYWKDVVPVVRIYSSAELTELIDGFLMVQRPRAAFHAVHMCFEDIETSRLKQLMHDIATVNAEPTDQFIPGSYYISEALDMLDNRVGITSDEMAKLEFQFIGALDNSEHGIPNLERQIAQSPSLFVQVVALGYKRDDEEEDPPEWRIQNPEQRKAAALAAYSLLDQLTKIPGMNEKGRIDLEALDLWLAEVRRLCREHGRGDIGDHRLGQLLAKAPVGENGIWPCEEVCEVMEEIASHEIGRGFYIGVHNSRGVYNLSGGKLERELAAKYRAWAESLRFDYPYVGSILDKIADSYEHEAAFENSRAMIDERLHY